jgi:hypothetical protein
MLGKNGGKRPENTVVFSEVFTLFLAQFLPVIEKARQS